MCEHSSFESGLKLFRFDEAHKTVPGHQEVDALLCVSESLTSRTFHGVFYFAARLVVNIHLYREERVREVRVQSGDHLHIQQPNIGNS